MARSKCNRNGSTDTTFGPLPVGGSVRVLNNAGAPIFTVTEAGTVTGLTVPKQMLMAVSYPAVWTCAYTAYQTVSGTHADASESGAQSVVTHSATVRNLRYRSPGSLPSGETHTITVRKNGAATALTCGVVQGAGTGSGELSDSSCADTTHSFSVVTGDVIATESVCSGGSTTNVSDAISMELE